MNSRDEFFRTMLALITFFCTLILFVILIFILKESLPFFKEISFKDFIFGDIWRKGNKLFFGLKNIIKASVFTSFLSLFFALPFSIGFSLFIVGLRNYNLKRFFTSFLNLLAGVPSVIYGFLGLTVIVKFFEIHFNMPSGESVLAGSILLSLMIIPYITSVSLDQMQKSYLSYEKQALSLGISKSFFLKKIILKDSLKNIIAGSILGLGRAFGETMAVMMVIGNAPIYPTLLGKAQTIPSLIALEMGMVELRSLHYHSLFAAGFVLMVITIFTNLLFNIITSIGEKNEK